MPLPTKRMLAPMGVVLALAACGEIVGLGRVRKPATPSETGGSDGAGGAGGSAGAPNPCVGNTVVWAKQFGDASRQFANGAAADSQGGVFVVGHFEGAIDLGGGPLTSAGSYDAFLAHLDKNGNHLWSRRFGDDEQQTEFYNVASTPDGGVVVAGSFSGTVDFGDGVEYTGNDDDAFVARYDAAGNHLWSRVFSGPSYQVIGAVTTDPLSGDVYVAGLFHVSIDFTDGMLVNPGPSDTADGFVAKLDGETGKHLWSRRVGSVDYDVATGVAVNASGQVAVGGHSKGNVDFGYGPQEHAPDVDADAWVAMYEVDGDLVWATLFADEGLEIVDEVAFASNELIVAGQTDGSFNFGEPTPAFPGAFFTRLTLAGDHVDSRGIGNLAGVAKLRTDAAGNIFFSSMFSLPVNLGAGPLRSAGATDGVVVELGPTLDLRWARTVASEEDDAIWGLDVADDGYVFAAALFSKTITIPECGSFTSAGDNDVLVMKIAP